MACAIRFRAETKPKMPVIDVSSSCESLAGSLKKDIALLAVRIRFSTIACCVDVLDNFVILFSRR